MFYGGRALHWRSFNIKVEVMSIGIFVMSNGKEWLTRLQNTLSLCKLKGNLPWVSASFKLFNTKP